MMREEWVISNYKGRLPDECKTCKGRKCIYDCPVLADIIETFYFSFK